MDTDKKQNMMNSMSASENINKSCKKTDEEMKLKYKKILETLNTKINNIPKKSIEQEKIELLMEIEQYKNYGIKRNSIVSINDNIEYLKLILEFQKLEFQKLQLSKKKNELLEKIEYFTSMGIKPHESCSKETDVKDLENILLIQMNKFDKKNSNKETELCSEISNVLFTGIEKYGQFFIEKNINDNIEKEKSSELLNLAVKGCKRLVDKYINEPINTNATNEESE